MNEHDAEPILVLLRALLAQLRRSRQTPLQFGIDSEGIVAAALKQFFASAAGNDLRPCQDWQFATAVLDELVAQFLQPGCRSLLTSAPTTRGCDAQTEDIASPRPLAIWLERFYTVMTEVQPRALDIAALRVEGLEDRDIAERLELGLRLVKRIVQDMRSQWTVAVGVPPAPTG